MKPTDFAKYLTSFFSEHLPRTRNLSQNTIKAYRDSFRLLLLFCYDVCNIPIGKITINKLDDKLVIQFLDWIQKERKCSVSTRNQRLAALHAFFRYVEAQAPEYLLNCQMILQIPFKKHSKPIVTHLTPDQTRCLLSTPNPEKKSGRRDMTLLSVLYDTGARVQELCDLRIRDVRLEAPAIISLTGKGCKTRHVPLLNNTVRLLQSYMTENHLFQNGNLDMPLFYHQRYSKLSRGGVNHILQKYAKSVEKQRLDMPRKITAHVMRHSKAMHLYQAGVNLVYIRDILGHVDISTTDIYARADIESKRKALESAYPDITPDGLPEWNHDANLLNFLNSF